MEVQIFNSADVYKMWLEDYVKGPIEIISTLVFQDQIVVTFKRK